VKKHNCHQCQHFFITFDKTLPHGCRAFNFKTRELPCMVVEKNSAQECYAFEAKLKKQAPVDPYASRPHSQASAKDTDPAVKVDIHRPMKGKDHY